MSVIDNLNLPLMLEIATRSVEFDKLERVEKQAKNGLRDAYRNFKEDNNINDIERDSPEWDRMLFATQVDYTYSEQTKVRARNAKRRLQTKIRQLERIGGAA